VGGSTATINQISNRSGTGVIIQQSTNGTSTGENTSFYVVLLLNVNQAMKYMPIYQAEVVV